MCAALLTFVCMLRYSEWNAVPIWSLYSSVLIVVRCADLVPVFFDTYRNILYQSDISGQDAQSASIPRMFFPVGWKRQPHPPLKTSKTSPTSSTPGAMPPSSDVPQPHPPTKPQKHPRLHPLPGQCHLPLASLNHIHLTKPQTYPRLPPMLRADVKKNLSHRHETPAFSFPGLP